MSSDGFWLRLLRVIRADPEAAGSSSGRWPTTYQGFVWDLAPDSVAPARDGVAVPRVSELDWVGRVPEAELDTYLRAERQRREEAQAAVTTTEAKASRLLTPIVALLAGNVALVAFELKAVSTRAGSGRIVPMIGGIVGAIAIALLMIAAIRGLDADLRVGVYESADGPTELKGKRAALRVEAQGTQLAQWVSGNKATRLMYARASFSKALAAIAIALILGGVTLLTPASAGHADPGQECQRWNTRDQRRTPATAPRVRGTQRHCVPYQR